VCIFLGRAVRAPQIRRVDRASKAKAVHFIHIRHRDEVEAPITDWLQEAYELQDRQTKGEDGSRTAGITRKMKRTTKSRRRS
jgi:hypothetical protein